jgi:phosphatidylglycerophosphate synthase
MVGLAGQLVVLLALLGAGLGPVGWLAGLGYGVGVTLLLVRALVRSGGQRLGPADKVTLARSTLVGGVLALVINDFVSDWFVSDWFGTGGFGTGGFGTGGFGTGGLRSGWLRSAMPAPLSVVVLVAFAVTALVLDGVDGRVARRTGTASALGARFDMEVDSMLILILSVHAVRSVGWWVVIIGAARFLFLAAGLILPWMRKDLPFRYWAKVVAVIQAVVLIVVAAGVLPPMADKLLCLAAFALLVESFGRSVWWLATHRATS